MSLSSRLRGLWPHYALALAVFFVDRLTKVAALFYLEPGRPKPFLGALLHLDLVRNSGMAFGMLKGSTSLLTAFSLVAVVVIPYLMLDFFRKAPERAALALILGGTAGNLYDRAGSGLVIDFLDSGWWPVFNVADSCIVIGAVLLGALILFRPGEER